MIARDRYRLAIDFGTSTTVAMLQWPDGRIRPLLFDGSPLLPSAVVLGLDGRLHTGRDAAHLARSNPERLETNPKRRIDDGTVLLGEVEVPVLELIAAVLRRVAVEAGQVAGAVGDVTLTHPAAWGGRRRGLLAEAAERAGLVRPNLVSEPIAAAAYFARTGAGIPPGTNVVVYDLGAGTCDVTVLRRQAYGFDVVGSGGLADVGGLDVDAAIVAFLEATHGRLWTDTASRRQLWDEVRTAKEMLSRAAGTVVAIPALGTQVPLGREQLDGLVRPVLRPTTALAKQVLRDANLGGGPIAGPYLVGGSSRIPLCATLLHETLGVAPVVTEQPELVVAEGGLYATAAPAPAPAPAAGPVAAPTQSPVPMSGAPTSGPPPPAMPSAMPPWMPGMPPGTPPPGMPQPGMPAAVPQPAGRLRRRPGVLITAAVLAFLLLVTGGAVGYRWLDRTLGADNKGTSAGSGRKSGSNTGSGTNVVSGAGATRPPKYPLDRLPERPCDKADIGPVAGIFEAELATPTQQKNLTTYVSTFICIHSRHHVSRGVTAASAIANYFGYIYADVGAATNQHKTNLVNARLNGSPTTVDGIAQEAFIYRRKDYGENVAYYILHTRDENLLWEVQLIATQLGGPWSEKDLTNLQNQLIASAKASYGRITAG